MKTQGKSWIWDIKDSNSLITSLSIEYKGEFMTLNQKDPMIFYLIFDKLTPQLIKFNIPKTDWISLPALGGTGVFFSFIVNLIINVYSFHFGRVCILYCLSFYQSYISGKNITDIHTVLCICIFRWQIGQLGGVFLFNYYYYMYFVTYLNQSL